MRYTPKQYATALFDALQEKGSNKDAIITQFARLLIGNYDASMFPKIVMQFKKLERAHLGRHDVVVASARPLEKHVIDEVRAKVGEKSAITEVLNPALLGGMQVLINDEIVIDGTLKGRVERTVEQLLKVAE